MKTLTDSEFQDYLDEEVTWRRTELHVLKGEVREASRSPQSPRARATSRALAVMSYAHWEGYIKSSFDKLADTIIRRKPKISDAADEFVVAHLRHLLLRLTSGDPEARASLVELARGQESPRLHLRRDDLVRTHDNLRYQYFQSILTGFGLSAEEFELSRTFIDSVLCDRRNIVAHGKSSFPDADSVIDSADRVLAMIEKVRDLQIALLTGRQYLASA